MGASQSSSGKSRKKSSPPKSAPRDAAPTNGQAPANGQALTPIYDLEALCQGQDFASQVSVKRVLTSIPIRRPHKEWFIRTHPDKTYWMKVPLLEVSAAEGFKTEFYMVHPALQYAFEDDSTFSMRMLILSINRQGSMFAWPIRLAGQDGKLDGWNASAMECALEARAAWCRCEPRQSEGRYVPIIAQNQAVMPDWYAPLPDRNGIVRLMFKDNYVLSLDHPVGKRLRGGD